MPRKKSKREGNICDIIPLHEPEFWYGFFESLLVVLIIVLIWVLLK